MSKRQETPEWMESFFEAVYPEYTNLAVSIARGEEQILRDATRVIQELRAENARLREGIGGIEMTLLEKLKELSQQATPGPWRWTDVDYGPGFESYEERKDGPFSALWSDGANKPVMVAQDASSYRAMFDTPHDVDASLILAMVNALPALLEVAEAAKWVRETTNHAYVLNQAAVKGALKRLDAALAKLEAEA